MSNELIKKEKMRRKVSLGEIIARAALKTRLEHYKKLQKKIPETRYQLEDPLGYQADKIVEKTDEFYRKILDSRRELSLRKRMKLEKCRDILVKIVDSNLGEKTFSAKLLISQINVILGKK